MAMSEETQSALSGEFERENPSLDDPDIVASSENGREQMQIMERYIKQQTNLLLLSESGVEYEEICKLGRDNHAKEVSKGRDLSTGKILVKKVIHVRNLNAYEVVCQNEIRETGHSPKLYWVVLNHQNVELLMEFIEGQDVDTVLKRPDIDQDIFKLLAWLILDCGIEALLSFAEKGWNHGDLFEGNLMVENVSSTSCPSVLIKVIDFGYAKPFEEDALVKDFNDLITVFRILYKKLDKEAKKDMKQFLRDTKTSRINNTGKLKEFHLKVKEKKAKVYSDYCSKKINEGIFHLPPMITQKKQYSQWQRYSSSSSGLPSVDGNRMQEGLQESIPMSSLEQPDLESFQDLRIRDQNQVSSLIRLNKRLQSQLDTLKKEYDLLESAYKAKEEQDRSQSELKEIITTISSQIQDLQKMSAEKTYQLPDPRAAGFDVGKSVNHINQRDLTGTVTAVDPSGYVCVKWYSGRSDWYIAGAGGTYRVELL